MIKAYKLWRGACQARDAKQLFISLNFFQRPPRDFSTRRAEPFKYNQGFTKQLCGFCFITLIFC